VVVGRREGLEVVETVHGNGVLRGIVPDSGSVAGDISTSNVVRGLSADEETVATQNGVCSESGALKTMLAGAPETKEGGRTLKTSRAARVWRPDCL
jgi:hypothetical protein